MINESILVILSMINIVAISLAIYKKKFGLAWALAILQGFILIGGK